LKHWKFLFANLRPETTGLKVQRRRSTGAMVPDPILGGRVADGRFPGPETGCE
jgi:hypothetical protein